jgi:hypothetical protein
VQAFAYEMKRTVFQWLGRRGKRGSYNWAKFTRRLGRCPLPAPPILVTLFQLHEVRTLEGPCAYTAHARFCEGLGDSDGEPLFPPIT